MTGLIDDLRFGLRSLARNRGIAAAAALSLALGIGANTAIFSLDRALLGRSLGVRDPARLVALQTVEPRLSAPANFSYPNYRDYRDHNDVFSGMTLYAPLLASLTGHGEPRLITAHLVSGNYFSVLDVNPVVGRGFLPEEDAAPGTAPVAVVSYAFWSREFARDPAIASRSIVLNGQAFRIVGVAPPDFHGLYELYAADAWVPLSMYPALHPYPAMVEMRRALIFLVAGRLKPGITAAHAEASLNGYASELERLYPEDNRGRRVKLVPLAEAAMDARSRGVIERAGTVLLIVSGLVLLIACANVANLLLARGAARSREIAVRLALGAARWHLIRRLLAESLLLAAIGGALALALVAWSRRILWANRPPPFQFAGAAPPLDSAVLLYAIAICLGTGILFGLAPALRATRTNLVRDLKERTGTAAMRVGPWQVRSVLVAAQIAFSLIALIGAGLFLRSLSDAARINPGFDAAHLGVVGFNLGTQGYDQPRGRQFLERALERAAATPGVLSAALAKDPPFQVSFRRFVLREGLDTNPAQGRAALVGIVSPGYFHALGIPLLRGRDFSPFDSPTAPRVAIANQAAAARLWPAAGPIGRRIRFAGDPLPIEVIGVAADANYLALGEEPQPLIYVSLGQYYYPTAVVYVRSGSDPARAAAAVRRAIAPLDRNLLLEANSVPELIRDGLWAQRLSANLLGAFGLLALLLAGVGIYGVVSYSVVQRAREFGVRMALGATSREVQKLVLAEALRVVAVGILAGDAIALAASQAIRSLLLVTSPRDAATFILVPAVLGLVAVAACWLPALRATRIDPASALREE